MKYENEKKTFYDTTLFKSQKKRFPEYPGFELGNSDPIANHITTRPRGIVRN